MFTFCLCHLFIPWKRKGKNKQKDGKLLFLPRWTHAFRKARQNVSCRETEVAKQHDVFVRHRLRSTRERSPLRLIGWNNSETHRVLQRRFVNLRLKCSTLQYSKAGATAVDLKETNKQTKKKKKRKTRLAPSPRLSIKYMIPSCVVFFVVYLTSCCALITVEIKFHARQRTFSSCSLWSKRTGKLFEDGARIKYTHTWVFFYTHAFLNSPL